VILYKKTDNIDVKDISTLHGTDAQCFGRNAGMKSHCYWGNAGIALFECEGYSAGTGDKNSSRKWLMLLNGVV
jgi:hypothetical protein